MKIETTDYFEVSENALVEEVKDAFHALKAFTLRLEGEIHSEEEYIASPSPPLIASEFRALYRYAVGAEPFSEFLDQTMSRATSFAMIVEELADGFESELCPGSGKMSGVITQAYSRYKVDHHVLHFDNSLMDAISCLFDEEDLEGLSTLQLAYLARMKQQSVRNKLSGQSRFKLVRNSKGKHYMNISEAVEWLRQQAGFNPTRTLVTNDTEYLTVPVARDGSFFSTAIRGKNGYRIGPKGSEVLVPDFYEALETLGKMSAPYWRRPSKKSGIPGIVTGIRWERKPLSEVVKGK